MSAMQAEYRKRIERLAAKMRQANLDGYLATHRVDLYYLTGTMQAGYLFISADGEAILYVRKSVPRAQEESQLPVQVLGAFRDFGKQLKQDFSNVFAREQVKLATDFDVLPVQWFERLKQVIPDVHWTDGSRQIREVRMVKSAYEISLIQASAQAVDRALEHALTNIKEGMSDIELMILIEQALRSQGHAGIMRMRGYNQELITGMVASGADAAVPTYFDGPAGGRGLSAAAPQSSGRKLIQRNEPILIDIGCMINGYTIDQTRTVVLGELPEHLDHAYQASESILRRVEQLLHPGTVCEALYNEALKAADEAGLSAHFMGYGADQVKFLGHGIGMEIDEFPVLARGFTYALEPGMILAIEPKFTFPGEGVVGIENTYAITENGFQKLTISREGLIRL